MITIEFNDDELAPALARLDASLGDLTPLMEELGELWLASTRDRMKDGEDAEGNKFAPRSEVTVQRYIEQGLSYGAPLNRSGDMRLNLAFDAGPDYIRIGSNAIQAAVMQFGAEQGEFGAFIGKDSKGRDHLHHIPWGDIPARPFLGFSEEDRTSFIAQIEDWLESTAAGGD